MKKIFTFILFFVFIIGVGFGNITFASSLEDMYDVKEYGPYEDISQFNNSMVYKIIFSQNGKGYAYLAKKDGKWVLVKDGIEINKYDEISPNFSYSSDGKSFVYLAKKGGKWFFIKDGIESEMKNCDYSSKLIYSSDFKSYACIIGSSDFGYSVVKDGIQGEVYERIDFIYDFEFSKDGKTLTYRARNNANKYVIVNNGVETLESDNNNSEDGKQKLYISKGNGYITVVKDGVEFGKYDEIDEKSLVLSSDGKSFAYEAEKNGEWFLVKDGIEIKRGSNLIYSPNSKSFAYRSEKDYGIKKTTVYGTSITYNYESVIRDGKEGKIYDSVGKLFYSSDSKSLAYIASKDNTEFIVKDNIESKPYITGNYSIEPFYNNDLSLIILKTDNKIIVYSQKNQTGTIKKEETKKTTNSSNLTAKEKQQADLYISKILKEISKKNGKEKVEKIRNIVKLKSLIKKAKTDKEKAILDYIITGISK